MEINAYIVNGTFLRFSNGLEVEIPKQIAYYLMKQGIKINYKYRKEQL